MPGDPPRIEDMDRETILRCLEEVHHSIRRVAHDMSNPLGILRMTVYFLRSTKPDQAKLEEYVDGMDKSIDRLDEHIRLLHAVTEFGARAGRPEGEQQ